MGTNFHDIRNNGVTNFTDPGNPLQFDNPLLNRDGIVFFPGSSPFYGMLVGRADPETPGRGAQALLNEPRLVAAVFWERRPDLLVQALAVVRAWPEVDVPTTS